MTAAEGSIRQAEYSARSRFGSLDGIRAVAVLAVVWHHTVEGVEWLPMTTRGFLGVDVFFVLSGFLIVTLLLREERSSGTVSLKNFYIRRSLRIFPVYYAILALMAAYAFISGSQSPTITAFRDTLPYYVTYLSNWYGIGALLAVSWSLAAEEQFYLIWPPIQKLTKRAALPILSLLIVANQLVNFGVLFADSQAEREILQVTFTPILFGVALAYLLHYRYDLVASTLGARATAPALAVALLAVINIASDSESLVGLHRLSIHVLMTLLTAAVVVREDHLLASPLSLRPLVRIGAVSYGVYLFHMFVRHVMVKVLSTIGLDTTPMLLFVTTAAGAIIAAELSFRYFESPLVGLKSRLGAERPTRRVAV